MQHAMQGGSDGLWLVECYLSPLSPSGFRNKEYNKVEDLYDTRIPLHNEDVFEHGLRFKAKVRVVVLRSHHLLSVLSYIGEFK